MQPPVKEISCSVVAMVDLTDDHQSVSQPNGHQRKDDREVNTIVPFDCYLIRLHKEWFVNLRIGE